MIRNVAASNANLVTHWRMKPCDARRERAGLGHVGKQQGKMARGFTGLFGKVFRRSHMHVNFCTKKPFPISPLIFEPRPRQPAALPRAQPPQDPDESARSFQGTIANAQRYAGHSREASTAFSEARTAF